MNWFTLLKQPKLRTGSKVTTNLGSSSDNESDGPCKKKILEYREKLKNMDGIMTDLNKGYNENIRFGREFDKLGDIIDEEIRLYINGVYPEFSEETRFSLLPEEVACKAIKMFSETGLNSVVREEIGDTHLCEVRKTSKEFSGKVYFEIALVIAIKTAPNINTGGLTVVDLTHSMALPLDDDDIKDYLLKQTILNQMDWGRT